MGRSASPSLDDLLAKARRAHESIHGVDDAAMLERAMEAGDALIALKAMTRKPRGLWSTTLAATGIPGSTARLYMQLARNRDRILAAGCTSIRQARRLLIGTQPRRSSTTTKGRSRPGTDRYQEGYADGFRRGRAEGYTAGHAAGPRARADRNGQGFAMDPKDLRWLITLAHPDRHQGNLRATRVTQALNAFATRQKATA
jgi:hypothetical protein